MTTKMNLPITGQMFQLDIEFSPTFKRNVYQVKNLQSEVVEFEHPTFLTAYSTWQQLDEYTPKVIEEGFPEDDEEELEERPDNVTPIH